MVEFVLALWNNLFDNGEYECKSSKNYRNMANNMLSDNKCGTTCLIRPKASDDYFKRCSKRTFRPIRISMTPPTISAFDL